MSNVVPGLHTEQGNVLDWVSFRNSDNLLHSGQWLFEERARVQRTGVFLGRIHFDTSGITWTCAIENKASSRVDKTHQWTTF